MRRMVKVRRRLTLERHITEQPGSIRMAKLCTSNKGFLPQPPSLLLPKGGLTITLTLKGQVGRTGKPAQSKMVL